MAGAHIVSSILFGGFQHVYIWSFVIFANPFCIWKEGKCLKASVQETAQIVETRASLFVSITNKYTCFSSLFVLS